MTNDDCVEVPWHDGTIRLLNKDCYILTNKDFVVKPVNIDIYAHRYESHYYRIERVKGVRVLVPSDEEPSVKVDLPTAPGSLIRGATFDGADIYFMLIRGGFWKSNLGYSYNVQQLLAYIGGRPVEVIFDPSKP